MSFNKKTIRDIDVTGKKVLVRADYNVPLDESGNITDDYRIQQSIPTLRYLLEHGASVILCSHLGRPDGKPNTKESLFPVAKRLRELLEHEVEFVPDCTGERAKKAAEKIRKDMPAVGLSKVASELKKKGYDVQVGASGLVPKSNHDGGLTQAAGALKVGAISEFIKSNTGDGYYLVQLASKNDTQLSYNFLRITLTQFSKQLKELEQNNKIQRYISVQKTAEIKRK